MARLACCCVEAALGEPEFLSEILSFPSVPGLIRQRWLSSPPYQFYPLCGTCFKIHPSIPYIYTWPCDWVLAN